MKYRAWFFGDRLGQLFMSSLCPYKDDNILSGGWRIIGDCIVVLCDRDKYPEITYENSPQLIIQDIPH